MRKDWWALVIPLFYSSFGIGLVHSLFFGSLRRVARRIIRFVITILLLGIGCYLMYAFWF